MLRRIPSLNWLRVFEAAARTESFSGAAQVLHMTPSAVSQQIKALEDHLGTQLFYRNSRCVILTDAGHSFLPVVRQGLCSIEATAMSLFGRRHNKALAVQATLIFATSWLVPKLLDFERSNPDIQLHLTGARSDSDLPRADSELNILYGGVPRGGGESDQLMGEIVYAIATPGIARAITSPADLLAHRLIEVSTSRVGWLQLLEAAGLVDIELDRLSFVDTSEIALAMAGAGYGIALARAPATDHLAHTYGLEQCLKVLSIRSTESYYLAYRSLRSLSPAAQRFRIWLLEKVAEAQG